MADNPGASESVEQQSKRLLAEVKQEIHNQLASNPNSDWQAQFCRLMVEKLFPRQTPAEKKLLVTMMATASLLTIAMEDKGELLRGGEPNKPDFAKAISNMQASYAEVRKEVECLKHSAHLTPVQLCMLDEPCYFTLAIFMDD